MSYTFAPNTPSHVPAGPRPIHLSEILSALTFALDLTEGALPGHSLRCCLLGMRIGTAAGLSFKELASLYYALQMKDAGCSSNAARMSSIVGGGDDRSLKRAAKLSDWRRPGLPYLRELWRQCRPQASLLQRAKQMYEIVTSPENHTEAMLAQRCERGADIATQLQLGGPVAEAVRNLDEHWDGSGFPHGKRGNAIPILSRICLIAQQLDVFAAAEGPERAVALLCTRRAAWFDPELLAVMRSLQESGRLWTYCVPGEDVEETRHAVLALDPGLITELTEARIDRICEAFASIVDAKSPFTFRHSMSVMRIAGAIAEQLDVAPSVRDTIRRAALLHDLGKLSVSNSILDKEGRLTAAEWAQVREHPGYTGSILRRVPSFEPVALLAEQHHERLDGSGYPHGRRATDLSLASRIIALADCYSAMAETRPYRDGLAKEEVFARLAADVPDKLDAVCFAALRDAAQHWPQALPNPLGEQDLAEDPRTVLNWSWPPLAESLT